MHILGTLGTGSAREAIVTVLAEEFPLTATQLRAQVKRRFSLSLSYQAIHKEARNLVEKDVLVRDGKGFLLNPKWIHVRSEFFSFARQRYARKTRLEEFAKSPQPGLRGMLERMKSELPPNAEVLVYYKNEPERQETLAKAHR